MFFEGDLLTAKGKEFLAKYKDFPATINKILDEIVFLEEESKIARTAIRWY